MKSILTSFIAASTVLAISLSSPAFAQDEDAAAAQADKIVQQELMKKYEGEKGLLVKPREIDANQNPKLKALNEKFPSLWKQINPQIADAYTATAKPVNDKNSANAAKMRPFLADAFGKAIELRGGGSASSMLADYAPAQVEWMIGNVALKRHAPMPDDAFVSNLAKAINLPNEGNPEQEAEIRKALPAVLTAIKQAEAFLPPDQIGFIRAEFLAYFQEESKEAAPSDQSGAENTKQPISAEILVKTAGKAEAKPNPIGNVQVTYADGTKDLWTTKGNCSLAVVGTDGTVGWTVHGPEEKIRTYPKTFSRAVMLSEAKHL